jgi:hypothetical protein
VVRSEILGHYHTWCRSDQSVSADVWPIPIFEFRTVQILTSCVPSDSFGDVKAAEGKD